MESKYTITVHELLENDFDIGLKEYEIFDEAYRPILNNVIIEHFRFREIGFVNPVVWRNRLNQRMDVIMRNRFNMLYKNKMIDFNPLYNIDITEEFEREAGRKQAQTTSNSTTQKSDSSDTQQNVTSTEQHGTESGSQTVHNSTSGRSSGETGTHTTSQNASSTHGVNTSAQFPNAPVSMSDILDSSGTKNIDTAAHAKSETSSNGSDNTTGTSSENTSGSEDGTASTTGKNDVTGGSESLTTDTRTDNLTASDSGKLDGTEDENEHYIRKTKGSSAGLPFSKAMIQFKQFVDQFGLDEQVCRELNDLFMCIW